MELEEKVKFIAAEMLIILSDKLNATQKICDHVVNSVDQIFQAVLNVVQKRLRNKCEESDDILSLGDINEVFHSLMDCSVFEGLKTPDEILQFVQEEHGTVLPEKVVFLSKKVLKGGQMVTEDVDFGYVVPFQPALEQVLSCPEIMACVQNPLPVKEGVFTSALDGYFYRGHELVKDHPQALGFGLYTDGVNPTDTASSKSGLHSVTFIYWSLLNIHPKLRSSVRSVFLLGAVKSSVLKKYGFNKILENFIEVINKLKDGLLLNINGEEAIFYGLFVFCCGDNPALANIGGFKESHFADLKCRQCLVPSTDIFLHFDELLFPKRTMASHCAQLKELKAYSENPQDFEKNPSTTYGINRESVLMKIKGCVITDALVQDFMHDTIEGTLKLEICCLVSHVIDNKVMTLQVINDRIAKFGKYFGVNKPTKISAQHFENRNLRQSAAETLNLAYILPFALRKFDVVSSHRVSACSEHNLECYILRLQLVDLLMSKVLTVKDVDNYRAMIKKHHTLFQELYPGLEIPKLHYEVHMGTHILLYGPPSQFWCFRYEAKHAYFKRLFRIKRCLKNLVKTCCFSHQKKQASLMFLSVKGNEGPYLPVETSCGTPKKTLVKTLQFKNIICSSIPDILPNDYINKFTMCLVNGVKYRQQSVVVTAFHQRVPVFGEVATIFEHSNQVMFLLKKLDTLAYNESLHNFRVKYTQPVDFQVMRTSELVHPHRLPFIKTVGGNFITVPGMNFF